MTTQTAKKVTLATIKAFVRKNKGQLYIRTLSRFDGQTDGVEQCADRGFSKVTETTTHIDHNMGILGAWFVGSSRDYFTAIKDNNAITENNFTGFHVFNCCGSFDIVTKD
jgi:hypothetical protein